jgi:hypothetical protein
MYCFPLNFRFINQICLEISWLFRRTYICYYYYFLFSLEIIIHYLIGFNGAKFAWSGKTLGCTKYKLNKVWKTHDWSTNLFEPDLRKIIIIIIRRLLKAIDVKIRSPLKSIVPIIYRTFDLEDSSGIWSKLFQIIHYWSFWYLVSYLYLLEYIGLDEID